MENQGPKSQPVTGWVVVRGDGTVFTPTLWSKPEYAWQQFEEKTGHARTEAQFRGYRTAQMRLEEITE